MVKAMPNRAIVTARVKRIEDTAEPNVFHAVVELLSSESVPGFANFTDRFIGKTVEATLFLKPKRAPRELMRLVMKYEGDERGGSFYGEEG